MNNWYAPHMWPEEKPDTNRCIVQDNHGRVFEAEYSNGKWISRLYPDPEWVVAYWWRLPGAVDAGDDDIDSLRVSRDFYRDHFYRQCEATQNGQARADIAGRKLRQIEQALRGET